MGWERVFNAQAYGQRTYKHKDLPIYITGEFNFFRCVEFKDDFYGKTASELFNGNLRLSSGRYSSLFPGQKVSYWANNPMVARAEIKKHGAGCDILTFWAYDDATSSIPILKWNEGLKILDGRSFGVGKLIKKADQGEELTAEEKKTISEIMKENIDAIAYDSEVFESGENYIFLERGFKKLALRELCLRFGKAHGGNHAFICCADSSDYIPCLDSYGRCFLPKAKVGLKEQYFQTEEYKERRLNEEASWKRMLGKSDD